MHSALINWITASLPSHADSLRSAAYPPSFLSFSPSRFFLRSPLPAPFSLDSFSRASRIYFPVLSFLFDDSSSSLASSSCLTQNTPSPRIFLGVAPRLASHSLLYALRYCLLVYCIILEQAPNATPSASPAAWRIWLYNPVSRVYRGLQRAHRGPAHPRELIDQAPKRWLPLLRDASLFSPAEIYFYR